MEVRKQYLQEEEKASASVYEPVDNADRRNSLDKDSPDVTNRKTTKPESKIHRIMEKTAKLSPKSSFDLTKDIVRSPRHGESVATPKPLDLK